MPTFREIQDRINLDYLNRTDLGAETKRAVVRAIRHYEKNRFWFNQTATAIAVGTASASVALPADFLALDYVTVRDNSIDSIVTLRSFDRIAYKNSNTSLSGVVAEIAYFKDTLYFTPKPQSATSLTVYYTHSFPELSADADSNPWTSACEELIVHRATADILANVLHVADPQQVQSHKAWETEAYNNLRTGNNMRSNYALDGASVGTQQGQAPKKTTDNLP